MKTHPALHPRLRLKSLITAGALALSALTALVSPAALAQTPSTAGKVMRMIVPYAPGGPIDVTARLLADSVKTSWAR